METGALLPGPAEPAPPTVPEVAVADAEPLPLTLTDSAGPVEPPVAPSAEPADPPVPVAEALPCRARATDTAQRQAVAGTAPAPDVAANCATKDHTAFWMAAVSAVCAAGKAPDAVGPGTGVDGAGVDGAGVDGAGELGADEVAAGADEVGELLDAWVLDAAGTGKVLAVVAGALGDDGTAVVVVVVTAELEVDGVGSSAYATVAVTPIQHATMAAAAATIRPRSARRRAPRIPNKLQSPETDVGRTP
jgi:hypothetical protein